PGTSTDEGGDHQKGRRSRETKSREPPEPREPRERRISFGELVPDPLPDFEPVLVAALGHLARRNHRERPRDFAIERRARRAALEVMLDGVTAAPFTVVVECEVVFGEM